jgi:hypothetical protein
MDPLEQDQADIYGRILSDEYFADVPVLLQQKGVTDAEVAQALGSLNEHTGKAGVVAIVLMPTLAPEPDNTPGATYKIRHTIQVIETPEVNRQAGTGIGKSAAQVAHRVRQILQWFHDGRAGSLALAGMEPAPVAEGSLSYLVHFERRDGDDALPKVAPVEISIAGDLPAATVTLTCATPGAVITYTTDGSYPCGARPEAEVYGGPFVLAEAATLRAGAELAGHQQSNIRELTIT